MWRHTLHVFFSMFFYFLSIFFCWFAALSKKCSVWVLGTSVHLYVPTLITVCMRVYNNKAQIHEHTLGFHKGCPCSIGSNHYRYVFGLHFVYVIVQ